MRNKLSIVAAVAALLVIPGVAVARGGGHGGHGGGHHGGHAAAHHGGGHGGAMQRHITAAGALRATRPLSMATDAGQPMPHTRTPAGA